MSHRVPGRTLVVPPVPGQPVFPVSGADMAALLRERKPVTYQPNQPIYEFGDVQRTLFLIVRGRVKIYHKLPNRTEVVFTELGEREVFGEVAALYDGVRSASAVALELTDVLILEHDEWKSLLVKYPDMSHVLMRSMAHRLSRSSLQMRKATYHVQRSDATREYSPMDTFVISIAGFLGGGGFLGLFMIVLALWAWMYYTAKFDPQLVGLALTLSVVQVVFAVAVLNSQNRAAAHEKKLTDAEHYAIMETFHTLAALPEQLDAQHKELQELRAKLP